MESITIGRWMEAKILKLRRNRKKEIFGLSTFVSAGFFQKIGSDRKSGKNFSHPPTPFCAPEWAALIRPWSGGSRSDQGLFFSLWSLSGETRIRISRNFENSGRILNVEDFRVSHFVLGFLDPRSKFSQPRTTKGFDSVRVGTRMTTNDDESRESFSNSSNESVFFRSEKAEDF